MDINKTIKSLQEKLYTVKLFDTAKEAADYIDSQIDGRVVGFVDSRTIIDIEIYKRLSDVEFVF